MIENTIVRIRRQWNDYRIAELKIEDLTQLSWDNFPGGVLAKAPQYFIHGYCYCDDVMGELGHSCTHGSPPHWIMVCVVKKDNEKQVYERLLDIVGPKPR